MMPLLVPTHMAPRCTGDGEKEKIAWFGGAAPAGCDDDGCTARSVRSGLIASQCTPPSVVFITCCVQRYSVCGSCGEKASGVIWTVRSFAVGTKTCAICPVRRSKRTMVRYQPSE